MSKRQILIFGIPGLICLILAAAIGIWLLRPKTTQLTVVSEPTLAVASIAATNPPTSTSSVAGATTGSEQSTRATTTTPASSSTTAITGGTVATPTVTAAPEKGIIPLKIRIPAIKVDTLVERVGVTKQGTMDVPKNIWNTAWFGDGGFRPGTPGNAVIAGHLDAPGTKAIFWDLGKLKPGDKIYLNDAAGRELTFEVSKLEIYPFNQAPLQQIFGPASEARLNLVTCNGSFDRASQNYDKRLIVYSRLVSA